MELSDKQKSVLRGVAPAALATIVFMLAVPALFPASALPLDEAGARLAWALKWALLPVLALMVSIMRVANHRFVSPQDIDGSGLTEASAQVRLLRAILQNTLEQAVLAVAAYAVWAAVAPFSWLPVIPAGACLFVAGRLLFAVGYGRGAGGRATGFGLTAYPTFTMLAALGVMVLLRLARWVSALG